MKKLHSFFEAVVAIASTEEAEAFFKDLCTPVELKAMENRWEVCQKLSFEKKPYHQIHKETGVSLTTIGRVARFLTQEKNNGYIRLLNRLTKPCNEK